MNWKGKVKDLGHPYEGIYDEEVIEFVTGIIEKLIEDIPDKYEKELGVVTLASGMKVMEGTSVDISDLKQQLRDKWLTK